MVLENATLLVNETINQTATAGSPQLGYLKDTLWPRITDLLTAPATNHDMFWTLIPMLTALVLMQIYFGRNKEESLGWNTAFGNATALIFISTALLRQLFIMSGGTEFWVFIHQQWGAHELKFVIVILLFMYGILLATLSYYHWLPERLAFFIMSSIPINVTAYVVIVLVNSTEIPLDIHTVFAGVLIFVFAYVISKIIRAFIPASAQARITLLERRKALIEANINSYEMKSRGASDFRKARIKHHIDRKKESIRKINEFIAKLKTRL